MKINFEITGEYLNKILSLVIRIFILVLFIYGLVWCTAEYLESKAESMTGTVRYETKTIEKQSEPVIVTIDASQTDCIKINGRLTESCKEMW